MIEPTVGPDAYGEAFAGVYDDWYADVTDAAATADFVAARAGRGPVIELGVGTGRLAAPLLQRGMTVIGVDASASMLERCASKGFHSSLQLVRADMAGLPLRSAASAALIAFNTLFNVGTAIGQQQVFHELRQALTPDGVVIVEALDLDRLDGWPLTSVGVRERRSTGLTVVATAVDPVSRRLDGRHVDIEDDGVAIRSWQLRLATAGEIDAFASNAGFRLTERYADWDCRPHEQGDDRHISVYRARATAHDVIAGHAAVRPAGAEPGRIGPSHGRPGARQRSVAFEE